MSRSAPAGGAENFGRRRRAKAVSYTHLDVYKRQAVIDPYTGVPGYPELSLSAGEVYTSHDHDDHGWVRAVRIEDEPGESPFKVTTVDCFHDPEGGALRGGKDVYKRQLDSSAAASGSMATLRCRIPCI